MPGLLVVGVVMHTAPSAAGIGLSMEERWQRLMHCRRDSLAPRSGTAKSVPHLTRDRQTWRASGRRRCCVPVRWGRNALGARIWRLLMAGRALVTGATGFVGRRLALALAQAGWEVRGMVRDRAACRARELEQSGLALHEGDVLRPETRRSAGQGVDVAYYLIHSRGRGGGGDFVASERAAARSFAQMARKEGIERVVYLGGLGDRPHSKHLRSRHETALALAEHGPPLTYFRAGMVVGAQSESYRTLRYLGQGRRGRMARG